MSRFFTLLLIFVISIPYQGLTQKIPNGNWKGIIHYDNVDVPFKFNFNNTSKTSAVVTIYNAKEEIIIDNVIIKNDSVFIPMYVFDAELKAVYKNGMLDGEWHKNYKNTQGPKFTARLDLPRFNETTSAPNNRIENRWDITFTQPNGQSSKAVGLFTQSESKIEGTILTEVGDFRYFEGVAFDDSVKMSSFDGVHAFMMLGNYDTGTWTGEFHYESGYSEKWTASYNEEATLPNPFSLLTVEPEKHKPYYDILTAGGDYNSIDTDLLNDKVVIIQLMGTWCPNSLDQTKYLTEWYQTQNKNDLTLMAITYEPGNKEYAQKRIDNYSQLLDIPYPMYIGGSLSKGQAALAFPNMGKINAFPTLVMIDKQGYIRYIDSYFNGPATGSYYQKFDKDFNEKVSELLQE